MRQQAVLCFALMAGAAPSGAEPIAPGGDAQLTGERQRGLARVELPVGAWSGGQMPVEAATGAVSMRAWRLPGGGSRTPFELLEPLRARLTSAGYETVFECTDVQCGGFDFRYAAELLPEPAMHVDLGDFHWLTAKNDDAEEAVAIMASRSQSAGFLHITHVGPRGSLPETVTLSSRSGGADFLDTLVGRGRATLEDLDFATGAARLSRGDFASLDALAGWLEANPGQRLRLVGHTDSQGKLDRNIALSEARAASVRDRLVNGLGVDPAQIAVQGLGPSVPRATNDTAAGRQLNRRVEAVLD